MQSLKIAGCQKRQMPMKAGHLFACAGGGGQNTTFDPQVNFQGHLTS